MTKEQLSELAEALNILTAKSSIVKERRELQTLLEDNLLSEAVRLVSGCTRDDSLQMQESKERPDETDQKTVAVSKRVRSMIKKIDSQLEKYDEKVGSSLNIIHTNAKGQISLKDLETAFRAIKHAPDEEMVEKLGEKLDVDKDGFVVSLSLLCKGYD
jgi:LETM1 and EF-hand domain-containing protein 1